MKDLKLQVWIGYFLFSKAWQEWKDTALRLDEHYCCSGIECICQGDTNRDIWEGQR